MLVAELILIVFCMIGAAFFSGIETGVISIHPVRLRHLVEEGSRKAKTLHWFLDSSDRLLGTTLVGTNICVVVVSVLSASAATRINPAWGKAVSSVIMTLLLLIFSEYMPKAWFQSKPLERCSIFAQPLYISSVILRPISAVIVAITGWLIPKSDKGLEVHQPFVTKEDLKTLTRELGQHGVISPKERVMIHRVFEMSNKTLADIMIPRDNMVTVNAKTTLAELEETARRTGYTRFPVYDQQKEQFAGIANAHYTIATESIIGGETAGLLARPACILPADTPVDDVLARMKYLRQPMCLVAGEGGDIIGLVTREDVLEEIVGTL